jgi:hypothetical protein
MLRYITASILLIAFAVQTFQKPAMMLGYYLNKAAYTRECVNKARPMLHCNGKCALAKKIREQQKKEQESPEKKTESKTEVIASRSSFTSLPLAQMQSVIDHHSLFIATELPGLPASIFHPPLV